MSVSNRIRTDEELIAAAVDGDVEAACEELFRRYRKKVYLWCFAHVRDADEAVDAAQEVFIKLCRSVDRFGGRSSFSTWLYRIVRNHALNLIASTSSKRRLRQVPVEDVELVDDGLREMLREAEVCGSVERLLDRAATVMKPEEIDAFVLHYRDALPVKEITRLMGLDNATGARTLIQNARRKFRRMVDDTAEEGDGRDS